MKPGSIASALQRAAGDRETQRKVTEMCVFLETKVEYISHTGTAELTFRGLYTRVLVPGVWSWVLHRGPIPECF